MHSPPCATAWICWHSSSAQGSAASFCPWASCNSSSCWVLQTGTICYSAGNFFKASEVNMIYCSVASMSNFKKAQVRPQGAQLLPGPANDTRWHWHPPLHAGIRLETARGIRDGMAKSLHQLVHPHNSPRSLAEGGLFCKRLPRSLAAMPGWAKWSQPLGQYLGLFITAGAAQCDVVPGRVEHRNAHQIEKPSHPDSHHNDRPICNNLARFQVSPGPATTEKFKAFLHDSHITTNRK